MGHQTLAVTTVSDRSRLERALLPLLARSEPGQRISLLERLAGAIDLTGAIALSDGLRTPQRPAAIDGSALPALRECVLAAHRDMLDTLARSFGPDAQSAPIPMPRLDQGVSLDGLGVPERLARFYTHHQRELEVAVQQLRVHLRAGLEAVSPAMAQLAALDRILGPAVEQPFDRVWSSIPRWLADHAEGVLAAHDPGHPQTPSRASSATGAVGDVDHPEGDWQSILLDRVRELLLAELELRMQPVLGLLEAAETHRESIS